MEQGSEPFTSTMCGAEAVKTASQSVHTPPNTTATMTKTLEFFVNVRCSVSYRCFGFFLLLFQPPLVMILWYSFVSYKEAKK